MSGWELMGQEGKTFLDGRHYKELGLGTGSSQCLIPLGTYPRRLGLPSNEIQIHLIEHGS